MKNVPVATFNEMEPALHLQERLDRADIKCTICDESKIERFWFMSEPLAAIHVEVNQVDYLVARRMIEDLHAVEGILKSAVRCPDCHSSRVEFPQLTRKFIMPGFVSVLMALRIIPRKFYCLDCHFTWPTVAPVEVPRDILGWPRKPEGERDEHPQARV
jgi:Zn finger protein HypA/HybF involved in hydrogenase expression